MSGSNPRRSKFRARSCTLLLASLTAGPALAQANHQWTGTTGSWEDPNNWNTGEIPGGTAWQSAEVSNGGNAIVSTNVVPGEGTNPAGELNEIWAGNAGGAGTITVNPGGRLRAWQFINVGRTFGALTGNTGSRLLVDGGTLGASVEAWRVEIGAAWNTGGKSTDAQMVLSGNSTLTYYSWIMLGMGDWEAFGAEGTLIAKDNSVINHTGFNLIDPEGEWWEEDVFAVGRQGSGGTGIGTGDKGVLVLQDNSQTTVRSRFTVGQYDGGNGEVTLSGNASLTVDPNAAGYGAVFMLGDWSPVANLQPRGVVTQSGSSVVTVGNSTNRPAFMAIGNTGHGTYTLNGGTLTVWTTDGITVGATNNGTNIGQGVLILNGGVLQANSVHGGAGTSTVIFNGTLLRAIEASTGFITGITNPDVAAGGLKVDSNGFDIASNQNLSGIGGLTKSGAGKLTLTGTNAYSGATVIEGGALQVALAAQNPILNGAGADIKAGKLIFDYTGGSAPAVNALLTTSYNASKFTNPSSKLRSSTAAGSIGLGWSDDGASAITVMATYYGDANIDGLVNSQDFNALVGAFGATSGAVWAQGDFDYNGKVNTQDFNALAGNFNATALSPQPSLGAVVPEPSSLAALAVVAMFGRRRRHTVADV